MKLVYCLFFVSEQRISSLLPFRDERTTLTSGVPHFVGMGESRFYLARGGGRKGNGALLHHFLLGLNGSA